jgi:MFS transporter, DHA3 family, macrolide efflux protein
MMNAIRIHEKKWTRPYFTIWTGQAFSLLGSQLVQFALIWWLTKTTGSATVLAVASLVGLLPQVVLGPVIGAFVDRWNRRLTMIIADVIIASATIALAVLFALGEVQIWQVYLLMFIRSLAGGFHWPAMQASTTLMVPEEHLSRVQGLNQMLQGGLNIVSAPLGALLIELLPMQSVLAIDIGTAAIAISTLFFIAIPQPARSAHAQADTPGTSIWQDFKAGLRYVWSWPSLLVVLIMATAINFLLTPAFSLLPILVTRHFGGQALQLAWIQSIGGIGIILGGLLLSAWGGFRRRMYTTLMGLIGMGVGSLALGLLPPWAYTLGLVAMFLVGFFQPITNGPLFAALQATVAPEMQGRVFTLIGSASAAMAPLGLIIAGPIADALGVQTWFIIGGIVTAAMGIGAYFLPAAVNFEQGSNYKPDGLQPEHSLAVDPLGPQD